MRALRMLRALVSRLTSGVRPRPPGDAFIPIVDAEGRPVGIMDQLTARYLESTAPGPSQVSLDEVLAQVTRVRVLDWEEEGEEGEGEKEGGGIPQRTRVLAEFTDAGSLAQLRDCLRIVEDPATFGHCMCFGEEAIELRRGTGTLATIGIHHGYRIRWDRWKHDAVLEDGRRLLAFLAERGLPGPLDRYEESQREAGHAARAADRWRDAMPSCLRPFWDEMNEFSVDVAPMRRALEASLPDPTERALVLFQWLGSGRGVWTGFPSYEQVAERLLVEEPTEHLVSALARAADTLTEAHVEGAARYFAGWDFRHEKPDDVRLLPRDLCRRLLAHTLTSTDADKVERARRAFAE